MRKVDIGSSYSLFLMDFERMLATFCIAFKIEISVEYLYFSPPLYKKSCGKSVVNLKNLNSVIIHSLSLEKV